MGLPDHPVVGGSVMVRNQNVTPNQIIHLIQNGVFHPDLIRMQQLIIRSI